MPNQWTKAKETGVPYLIKDETRAKLSKATTEKNLKYFSNKENKDKHSASMKQAVEKFPESYSSSNRGRTKQIIIDGIKFQGQWEVDFYLWAKKKGLEPERPSVGFKYTWNGIRTYFPDFYIPSLDTYVEIKGYETERDQAKWLTFPKKLIIIKKKEINEIRKDKFNWAGSLAS